MHAPFLNAPTICTLAVNSRVASEGSVRSVRPRTIPSPSSCLLPKSAVRLCASTSLSDQEESAIAPGIAWPSRDEYKKMVLVTRAVITGNSSEVRVI